MSVYEDVTNRIIVALETGAADPKAWQRPWAAISQRHTNAAGRPYRGINTMLLGLHAAANDYTSTTWGTYNQWQGLNSQVRKGEKGVRVVLWKSTQRHNDEDGTTRNSLFATTFSVFNAAQVDDATNSAAVRSEQDRPVHNNDERLPDVDEWITTTGANIKWGSDQAAYNPTHDFIVMPSFEQFEDAPSFYGTTAHELVHWTGHESRLARDLNNRFGGEAYAAEELIAELGSAFIAARLGFETTPRLDHAHYIKHWLQILRNDSRAVFTAATKAQAAADHLCGTDTVGTD